MSEIKTIDELFKILRDRAEFLRLTSENVGGKSQLNRELSFAIDKVLELKRNLSITDSVTQSDTKIMQPDNRWISVKDRLPSINDCTADETIIVYDRDNISWVCDVQDFPREMAREGITHWQPLPTPPEADND